MHFSATFEGRGGYTQSIELHLCLKATSKDTVLDLVIRVILGVASLLGFYIALGTS